MPHSGSRPAVRSAAPMAGVALALLVAFGCRATGPAPLEAPAAPGGTAPASRAVADTADPAVARLAADVAALADRAMEGRATGSPGGARATRYLLRRHEALALDGAFPAQCRPAPPPCPAARLQPFSYGAHRAQNVAARISGRDPVLRERHVVIAAHFDHVGRAAHLALDAERGAVVRPGADDNASGTAALLELARRLAERPTRRSVFIVHFDAEELGLVGSRVFLEEPPVPREALDFMLNLDMVGRLGGAPLQLDDSAAPRAWLAIADSAVRAAGLRTARARGLAGRSDHASFGDAGIPAVALFTGFHADYHRESDVAERVDVPGLLRVVDAAEAIVRAVADRDAMPGDATPAQTPRRR